MWGNKSAELQEIGWPRTVKGHTNTPVSICLCGEIGVLPAYVCLWAMYMQCPLRPEDGAGYPSGLELRRVVSCYVGAGNPIPAGPLEEQPVFLTSEPPLSL